MAKKKTVEKVLNIDSILFNCRDYLRAARNSGSFFEKRDMMLTLVFLRFIADDFKKFIADTNPDFTEDEVIQIFDNVRLVGSEMKKYQLVVVSCLTQKEMAWNCTYVR